MKKGKQLSLICKSLLLPFINPDYSNEDLLQKKAILFNKFLNGEGRESKIFSDYHSTCEKIITQISERNLIPERLDELYELLDMFYSDNLLISNIKKENSPYSLNKFYIKRINEISDSFITLRDGWPALRSWHNTTRSDLFPAYTGLNKAELWNMLVRQSTPDLWIASYYFSSGISREMLYNIPDEPIISDKLLMKNLKNGIADTHIHFNAAISYQIAWCLFTDITLLKHDDFKNQKVQKSLFNLLKAGILRLFLAHYVKYISVNSVNKQNFINFYKNSLDKSIFNILYSAVLKPIDENDACIYFFKNYQTCMQKLMNIFPELRITINQTSNNWEETDILFRTVYKNEKKFNTSADIILFYDALCLQEKLDDNCFRNALLQYIRYKNLFFEDKVQNEAIHGLKEFRKYFTNTSNSAKKMLDNKSLKTISINREIFKSFVRQPFLKLIEIKISPPSPNSKTDFSIEPNNITLQLYKKKICKQLYDIFKAYHALLTSLAENQLSIYNNNKKISDILDKLERECNISLPTLGIIYHFIKIDDKRSLYKQVCWLSSIEEKLESPFYIETQRKNSQFFIDALIDLFKKIPYLSEYVVGLDAASDELHNRPWVHAPVFLYARGKHNTIPIQPRILSQIPNIGLTYHVGEEFRSLVSGLRAIDEVIEHFGYKSGDRIGHAIALQISPSLWQKENNVVMQPRGEYLENLLWIWYIKNNHNNFNEIPDLEFRIMQLISEIYTNVDGITPYLLWKAYQLKFKPLNIEKIQNLKNSQNMCSHNLAGSGTHFCKIASSENHQSCLWNEYDLMLTNFCPVYAQKYQQPVFISISEEEVSMLEKLQNYVKQKVEQRGITVEVNPTSNATIGDIQNLFSHPILNLYNLELGKSENQLNHTAISINTDDPAVFRTTVEHEFAYMYYMLMSKKYNQVDVLKWIDDVRNFGLERSFIHEYKKPSIMYSELQILIEELEKYIK